MSVRLHLALRSLLLLGGAIASSACAEGATIDDTFRSSGSGDGGDSGDGGSNDEGGSRGDGGANGANSATNGSASTAAVSGTSVSSGTTSSSGATTTSSSSTTNSSTSVTTSAATTSSSTGGGGECDSVDPAPVCGPGQHCMPAPAGVEASCLPAGSGPAYSGCDDHVQCAPDTACIGVDAVFPCCLEFCHGPDDCGGQADSCYSFVDFGGPFYSDGVEVGFCYDDAGGCF